MMRAIPLAVLRWATIALLFALVAVPCGQIFFRSVLGLPFIGAEELSRFLLICLIFLGYPLVVLRDENIVLAELRNALPSALSRPVARLVAIGSIFGAGTVGYAAAVTISRNLNNATPTLQIPFWLFLSATVVAFAGAAIVHLVQLVRGHAPEQTTVL